MKPHIKAVLKLIKKILINKKKILKRLLNWKILAKKTIYLFLGYSRIRLMRLKEELEEALANEDYKWAEKGKRLKVNNNRSQTFK